MEIRSYHLGEEHEIWQLFHDTIHCINTQHYCQKQLDAWAPPEFDSTMWRKKLAKRCSFVLLNNNKIVGYSDVQSDGYINHFFSHHLHQGQGIGAALMAHIHTLAKQKHIIQLSADVSITAKAFFEAKGFIVIKQQTVLIRGQVLNNFKMTKHYRVKDL